MLVWFVLLIMGTALAYNVLGIVYRSPVLLVFSLVVSVFLVYTGFYYVDVPSAGTILQFHERELMWFFGSAMTVLNAAFAFIYATADMAREVRR